MLSFFKSRPKRIEYHSTIHSVGRLECYIGLGFRVLHPVILRTVSVRVDLFKHLLETGGVRVQQDSANHSAQVHILLWDPEEMIEAILVTNKPHHKSDNSQYYNYGLSSPLLLPAGFEGELKLSMLVANTSMFMGDDFTFGPETDWVSRYNIMSSYKLGRYTRPPLLK